MINKPLPIATAAEHSFFNRIEQVFSESNNVIGYFERDIGGLHPDFLILSPHFGVIVAEIKDYSPEVLTTISSSETWEKLEDGKKVTLPNPFDQV